MNYGDYRPIFFLPVAVATGRPAQALISLENFQEVPFTKLTVSISGPTLRTAEITKTPGDGPLKESPLEIPIEVSTTEPGEQEITVTISLLGAGSEGGPATEEQEEWRTKLQRSLWSVGGKNLDEAESLVIAEFAKVPGLGTAAERPTLAEALECIRENFSSPVRMPPFRSLKPQKRVPRTSLRPEPPAANPKPESQPARQPIWPSLRSSEEKALSHKTLQRLSPDIFPGPADSQKKATQKDPSDQKLEAPPRSPEFRSSPYLTEQTSPSLEADSPETLPHLPDPPPSIADLPKPPFSLPRDSGKKSNAPQERPRHQVRGVGKRSIGNPTGVGTTPVARPPLLTPFHWRIIFLVLLLTVGVIIPLAVKLLAKPETAHNPLPPAPAPTPTPIPRAPATPPPALPPVPPPPISEATRALDYFKTGGFLLAPEEGRRKKEDALRAAVVKSPNLRTRTLDVLRQGESLKSAASSGEAESAVLVAAQLRKTMDGLYASEPSWQSGRAKEDPSFQANLKEVLRAAFTSHGVSFIHNVSSRPAAGKLVTAALQDIKTTYPGDDQMFDQCRKAWANGAFAAMTEAPNANRPPTDGEKLKAIGRALPLEFPEAQQNVTRLLNLLPGEKSPLTASMGKTAILNKIAEELFDSHPTPLLSPSERRSTIQALLRESKDMEDWGKFFGRIIDCQALLEAQNYVEARGGFDEIKNFEPEKQSSGKSTSEDILVELKDKIGAEMLLAVGPVILKSNFLTESEALPLAGDGGDRQKKLKEIQTLLEKLANQPKPLVKLAPGWSLESGYGPAMKNTILSAQKACFPLDASRWDGKISPEFVSELTTRTLDK